MDNRLMVSVYVFASTDSKMQAMERNHKNYTIYQIARNLMFYVEG